MLSHFPCGSQWFNVFLCKAVAIQDMSFLYKHWTLHGVLVSKLAQVITFLTYLISLSEPLSALTNRDPPERTTNRYFTDIILNKPIMGKSFITKQKT